jgi:hypothetical protein
MAHRALIALGFACLAACSAKLERLEERGSVSQTQQVEGPTPDDKPPCDDDRRPPPPPNGGVCGACIDEHFVCCSAPEPCAGYCVPDCRPAPERCPPRTACDPASGVCLRQTSITE